MFLVLKGYIEYATDVVLLSLRLKIHIQVVFVLRPPLYYISKHVDRGADLALDFRYNTTKKPTKSKFVDILK